MVVNRWVLVWCLIVLGGVVSIAAGAAEPTLLLVQQRTMAPYHFLAESLDATAWHDSRLHTVNLRLGTTTVTMTPGSTRALVNNHPVLLDVAPQVRGGDTYLPLRFCLNTFGASLAYDRGDALVTMVIARHPFTKPPLQIALPVYALPGAVLYHRKPSIVPTQSALLPGPTGAMLPGPAVDNVTPRRLLTPTAPTPANTAVPATIDTRLPGPGVVRRPERNPAP